MDASALFSHRSPADVVAYRAGIAISAARLLADATELAKALPSGRHVLNVCLDRYRFTVGLAACLMTGRVSLLPSTHTPEVIRQLLHFAPDAVCLTDDPACAIDLPRLSFPRLSGDTVEWLVPQIPETQLAAIVFTSGSTGTPLPYPKLWGRLARCVRDGAPRLGLTDGGAHTLIGTVPAQHMYGFESTVLLALLSGNAFSAERPFYPADIAATVAAVPRPRALVSTPVHLRTLLAAGIELPPLDLIVSATAPLDTGLAHEVEATFHTRLLEIYGSTETGQIATRRTAESRHWHLWPGVRLQADGDQVFAYGGHVEQRTAMCDVIELVTDQEFLLHGRTADLVNVAGKRSSFAYLNMQLNAIAGVVDGAFFLRDAGVGGRTGVHRLAALVVAPSLTAAQLTAALRQRIDPVFLPRPVLLVERLPRNATGKLPQQALQLIAEQQLRLHGQGMTSASAATGPAPATPGAPPAAAPGTAALTAPRPSAELCIPADHAAFNGHFPGFPILPGAALLDAALHEIAGSRQLDLTHWRLAAVKFLGIVRPGDALTLEHSAADAGTIRFAVRNHDGAVATGTLTGPATATRDADVA